VRSECKKQANAQAKYGTPIWPSRAFLDYFGGLDYPRLPGIVVAIEPDAQFSNGFGAMVHSRVECKYNLQEKEVIRVEIMERQLQPFQPQSRMKSPN
jgi:hypothetical protein